MNAGKPLAVAANAQIESERRIWNGWPMSNRTARNGPIVGSKEKAKPKVTASVERGQFLRRVIPARPGPICHYLSPCSRDSFALVPRDPPLSQQIVRFQCGLLDVHDTWYAKYECRVQWLTHMRHWRK